MNFPLITDEYTLNRWAEFVADRYSKTFRIWKMTQDIYLNTTKYYSGNEDRTKLRKQQYAVQSFEE